MSIVGQTPAPLGSTDLPSIDVDILNASCREHDLGLLAGLGSSRSTEARAGAGTGSRCASTSGLEVVATGPLPSVNQPTARPGLARSQPPGSPRPHLLLQRRTLGRRGYGECRFVPRPSRDSAETAAGDPWTCQHPISSASRGLREFVGRRACMVLPVSHPIASPVRLSRPLLPKPSFPAFLAGRRQLGSRW